MVWYRYAGTAGTMVQGLVNCPGRRPAPQLPPPHRQLWRTTDGLPHQRGGRTVSQVAAGIVNSIINPYPLRPKPTHGESVEQKATARRTENAPLSGKNIE